MKSLKLTIVFLFFVGLSFSQKKSTIEKTVTSNTVPVTQTENSKFLGKYLLKLEKGDSAISYDFLELKESNGKIVGIRESQTKTFLAGSFNSKGVHTRFDCEIISIEEKKQTIVIKYNTQEYTYKFVKNKKGNYEIIIIDNALVYEKR